MNQELPSANIAFDMNLQDDLKQVSKDTVFQEKARTETLIFKERTQPSLFFGDDKADVSYGIARLH